MTPASKLPVRVLVIEDDDTLATLLLRALHRDGCFITHARDGAEGLEAFKKEQPHVVLCDGLLPKMTGFEVCKAIRDEAGDRVGLILMSAAFKTLSKRSKDVQEARADAFLSKPFVLGDLRRRVLDLAQRSIDVRRAAA
ncbi:MAG: response regulator, partial [Deltaproteobacteria bacterium]|nr:response regulator [Deltaproteobacteria bacterium]